MFATWGRIVYRYRWATLALSFVLLAASIAALLAGGSLSAGSPSANPTESGRGAALIQAEMPRASALVLALAKRPDLLLLDEPLASLDPLARREFLRTLMDASVETGMTVLLSSHNIGDLERVCDYLIILAAAHVQLVGDIPEIVRTHKRLVGPRQDVSGVASVHTIVEISQTARQTTLLVRTDGPLFDPSWEVEDVSLEDIVLAYLGQQTDARRPASPPAEREHEMEGVQWTWVAWRLHRSEGIVALAMLAVLAVLAAFLLLTGLPMADSYQQSGLAACLAHATDSTVRSVCGQVGGTFDNQYGYLLPYAAFALLALPVLLGAHDQRGAPGIAPKMLASHSSL